METHIEQFIETHLPNIFISNNPTSTIINLWDLFVKINGEQTKEVKDYFYQKADGEVFFYDL